jgi:biopolymer transport protein ExbD
MKMPHGHEENLEFQIAPMVDIIFLLILFFMCSAGSTRVENELSLKLPGRLSQGQAMKMIDEQIIEIDQSGQIILNNQKMDAKALGSTLHRYKLMAADTKSVTVVSVLTARETEYARIIDVLNECALAKIESVTFMTRGGSGGK